MHDAGRHSRLRSRSTSACTASNGGNGRSGIGIEVAAGWDHDAARLAKSAADHGCRTAESLEALLGDSTIAAVVIGSETAYHADLVEKAAAAGKAIVLQKPLALTLAEADRIVAAVAKAAVPFTVAWQMRVDPQNLRMKQLIADGTLGTIRMVRRRHGLNTHMWDWFADSWHVKPELNRGMWADDAAHAVDFLYWLLGEPQSVMAEIGTLVNPQVPDDTGIAVFRYADGKFAEVVCSFTCVAGENTTEIVGDLGTAIQNYGDVPSCNVARPANAMGLKWYVQNAREWTDSGIASPPNHGERIKALAEPLAQFLHGQRPPIATAEEGRTALRLTLACYESAAQGRRLRI